MGEHDVVGAGGDRMVERDGQLVTGERVNGLSRGQRPTPGEGGHLEDPRSEVGAPDERGWLEGRLAGQLERGLDDPLDGAESETELADAGVELVSEPGDLLAEVSFDAVESAGGRGTTPRAKRCGSSSSKSAVNDSV